MTLRIVRAAALAGASLALVSTAAVAAAADTEIVVVTGSYITGAAEQTALPVTVLSSDDLKKRGSPSMVDLIKTLPSSGAVFGDANQFTAGRTEGVSSVNLRNLSASRTLVLFNGRRITQSAASALTPLVDLNMFPTAAIGRIEVLKDGAAATYGSEAIGGVVNIITRENFEGLEVSADYRNIDGSNGDYNAGAAFGWGDEKVNVFLAAGYNKQSTLPATARDFATPKYTTSAGANAAFFKNPGGGWSGAASPGTFISASAGSAVYDPACASNWAGEAFTNILGDIHRGEYIDGQFPPLRPGLDMIDELKAIHDRHFQIEKEQRGKRILGTIGIDPFPVQIFQGLITVPDDFERIVNSHLTARPSPNRKGTSSSCSSIGMLGRAVVVASAVRIAASG